MTTYFITTIQRNKVLASRNFHRRKLQVIECVVSSSQWHEKFGDTATLAWNENYTLMAQDSLLYKDQRNGDFVIGEVGTVTYELANTMANTGAAPNAG